MADPDPATAAAPPAYYHRLDERRFSPTPHVSGAWQPGEQHMGPVAGLIVHAVDGFVAARGTDDLQISRLTYEILGLLGATETEVEVSVLRAGRTIELLEVTLTLAGRVAVRARVWRLGRGDTAAVAGGQPADLPAPESCEPWSASTLWDGGFIASLEMRPLPHPEPGRAGAWLRTRTALVAGEPSSDLARFVMLVDTANGIAVREPPSRWLFPNLDLTVHLYRQPQGSWVGLTTEVVFGASGVGLTSSVLHDRSGPVGRAEQILTVRPRPAL
ncbi:MAG: thioesterase [Friedmanniella sp.]|nr:thioesterase [Friedmanniella sp.]